VRDALIADLNRQGIKALFHYIPLHSSPFGQTLGYAAEDLPVTEDRSARLLRLPAYHDLSDADIDRITDAIHAFFGTRA
jgi:dTDP-4-amino-4,6-dideoxygalactose transaminase